MYDYIHRDVFGVWREIKQHPILNIYTGFEWAKFSDTFFALNIQKLNPKKIPTDSYKKIVISYHTEYFEHQLLWDFFHSNQDCKFLFLSDLIPSDIWPSNVTSCQWITWGCQLDVAIKYHSINAELLPPKYKFSSLSNRHEFHKAAITAFLLENVNKSDMILSWHNWCPNDLYYKDIYVPDDIQKYLNGPFQSIGSIQLDNDIPFNLSPVGNGNWKHPAYIDCAINITNETVFNSMAMINNKEIKLPAPYLTEKTWKPLLAGRPFIPVGQFNTINSLKKLGLVFDYGLDLSFDLAEADFDRILGIYNTVNELSMLTANEIFEQTYQSCIYNLNHISSGNFSKQCNLINLQSYESISKW